MSRCDPLRQLIHGGLYLGALIHNDELIIPYVAHGYQVCPAGWLRQFGTASSSASWIGRTVGLCQQQ
jgi:hypothetical protein